MGNRRDNTSHRYDFAISFAGDKRDLARKLSTSLRQLGFTVFFDEFLEHELIGVNGAEFFTQVFGRDSRYCVALISKTYDQSSWTRLEREVMEARRLSDRTKQPSA